MDWEERHEKELVQQYNGIYVLLTLIMKVKATNVKRTMLTYNITAGDNYILHKIKSDCA